MEEILYSTSILRFLFKFQTEVIEFRARQQHVFPKFIPKTSFPQTALMLDITGWCRTMKRWILW